ncbi:hypothetical protein [Prosthecobacter sp.]|uniref:hypothetical protein n=1 Tax=Prosthecobacter sp. TaxID=1965333 RepID=UPI002ABAF23F|nr:hypothetical protein [Prosthecobacter sp.]MDZ4406115.1 hypothetical protein [Prosthecobacter sp.]
MPCFARFFKKTVFACGLMLMIADVRSEALNAGLQQRLEKANAETRQMESERSESATLLSQAEALLAKAQADGDQESVPVIQKAITKARNAMATCDAGITAAKGRIEALTGVLQKVETMPVEPVIPASVVDLRAVKDFTVDPAKVKGYARGVREHLAGKEAVAVHEEIKARAGGRNSRLATMSYAELIASLDGQAQKGLKQGVAMRQKETNQELRRAFQLPEDSDEDLLDLILPPEPAKPTPLQQAMQQIKEEALRLLHSFDRVQNDEKERVFEAYQMWKTETEKLVTRVDQKQLTVKEYEDAYKLLDQRFLFSLTMIGKIATEKEADEITTVFPDSAKSRKGGAK